MASPPGAVDWRLLAAIEKHGKAQGGQRFARLTLGDALVALPGVDSASAMRDALLRALQASGTGYMEPGANGEVRTQRTLLHALAY